MPSEQEVGAGVGVFSCADDGRGLQPLGPTAAVELLCCRSKVAGEGAAGFDAKAAAVGLTCCRPKLVREGTVDSIAVSVKGKGREEGGFPRT